MNKVRPIYLYICLTLIVLAGAGFFAFKPFTAVAADTHDHSGWTEWTNSTSLPTTAGSYYLDTDVTLSVRWSLSVNITLCLNGHTIGNNGSSSYPTIDVKSGGTLDIYDCDGSGTVTNGSNYALQINNGGTANINGGNFITNSNSSHSAITNAEGGTLNMSGGEITFSSSGYGIDNNGGEAYVKNVKIIYAGSSNEVSGIYSRGGGTITVEDCEIDSKTGRCVYAGYGTVTLIGGRFNGDFGVRMGVNSAKFNLSGSPTFTCSTADIYMMYPNTNRITVTGTLSNTTPYSVGLSPYPEPNSSVEITDSSIISYNDATKFKAAKDGYIVRKNSSGQLELAVLETYTITYAAGSYGSGSVTSGTKTEGVDFTLSSETFTRTGYTQTGWSKNSNGSTKDYALGAIYTDDASITLYPYWTANSYIAVFDANGGGWNGTLTQNVDQTYDSAWKLPSTEPTRTGYTFNGWWTNSSAGTQIMSADKYTTDGAETVYAHWTECDHSNGHWGIWSYDADSHSHVCQDCGKTVTEEHKYSNWTVQDDTYHTRICECGRSDTAAHSWDRSKGTVSIQPTCTEKGTTTYPCIDNCGATHDEVDVDMIPHDFSGVCIEDVNGDGHYRKCEICGTPSDTVPHDWNEGTFTLGNCTTRSQTDFVCLSCGAEKTEYGEIVSDVHDWHDNGYNEEGHHLECSRCGETEISDHIWDEGTVDFDSTCVNKGQLTHHCTVAGCSETKTVELPINPDAHKWSSEWKSDENEHRHICENGCGQTYSAGHTWNNGETTKEAACTEAGEITFTCTECDYSRTETTEPKGHDFSGVWSFDENGHWNICTKEDCPEKEKQFNYSKHSWDSGKITKEPTREANGEKTYTCSICGRTKTETLDKLPYNPGNVEKEARSGKNAPKAELPQKMAEIQEAVFTEEDQRDMEQGKDIKILLTVEDASNTVKAEEKQKIEEGASYYTVGQYLDINLIKVVTTDNDSEEKKVTNTKKPIRIVIDIPENLKGNGKRTYAIVRFHEGQTTLLEDMDNNPDTITIETDRFSTYAMVYTEISPEANTIAMNAKLKVEQKGEKLHISWGKAAKADGYQVYVQYCGKKFSSKPTKEGKSAKTTKVTVTKLNGKKLNLKKNYKVYVTAYKRVNNKKVVIGKTITAHIAGENNKAYTNVKQVKVSKSKYTLEVGRTAKIKAKTVLVDKTKKQLSNAHAKELRYKSTDTDVAVVSAKGKITAKGKGTCYIYVYARNGYAEKVKVTVK